MKPRHNLFKRNLGIALHCKIGILAVAAFTAVTGFVRAETVIIESAPNGNGQNETWGTVSGSWNNSTGKSTVSGCTIGVGSKFALATTSQLDLTPVFANAGGTYSMEVTIPITSSTPTDLAVSIAVQGCTGLPTKTLAFAKPGNENAWKLLGTLVLDPGVTTPTITLTYSSTLMDDTTAQPAPGFGRRWFFDAIRFIGVGDPCLNVAALPDVSGPIAAGQLYVDVNGVSSDATAVTVYANGTLIGTKTSGITQGVNRVTTTALIKDERIAATQTIGGVEGCKPTTGPRVGGGANPRIRVNFLLRHDDTLTGNIGDNGGTSQVNLYCLGSGGSINGGFQNTPAAGTVINPDTCWQTVTFTHGVDLTYPITSQTATPGQFAVLDGLAFCLDDTDSGPYEIYIDNIVNGSTVISDFESAAAGTVSYLFRPPSFATISSSKIMSPAPNDIVVSTNNADTGTNSSLVKWQFKDTPLQSTWLRLMTQGTSGTPNPMVDLTQPISVRLLVLPVGQTNDAFGVSALGKKTNGIGDNVTFTASVLRGTGSFTYQWRSNSVDIIGETSSTLVLNNVQTNYTANYSCVVGNGTCSAETFGSLVVTEVSLPPTLTYLRTGSNIEFTWTGNFKLQSAPEVTGSWSDVGTTSPQTVSASAAAQFYRLITP